MKVVYHFFILTLLCLSSKAQTFDLYIANDGPVDSATYEFDVILKSTTSTTWALRTVQISLLVNPAWLQAGPDPTITYINSSSTLGNFIPGVMDMNATPNSLSAFQFASSTAGICSNSTQFTSNGQTEKVGRFRIVSNSGAMNCVSNNLSFIRPTDTPPGANVSLRVAVTKWSDASCAAATSTTISNNGTYTNVPGGILSNEYNNMAPAINAQPLDTTVRDCDFTQLFVSAVSVAGQSTAIAYQWYENGTIIGNNAIFNGVNDDTLTITDPPISMDGHTFYCVVSQCGTHTSDSALLTVIGCTSGISEDEINAGISVFPNPTKGKIYIQHLSDFKPTSIEIFNSLSQVVFHSDYKSKKGLTNEMNLNLPKGIYFIRFYSADHYIQKRLVIQ